MITLISIIGSLMLGTTVAESEIQEVEHTEVVNTPMYVGTASWYDYDLVINGEKRNRSKTHRTCAMRDKEHRYQMFRVCARSTGKCVDCYLNDRGPSREDRVIDLSSYAFKQLGVPLSRGLTEVEIYYLTGNLDALKNR